eukprot:m.89210 g.89210  ORF g.89210 m.89210 type:complete len:206 (+) comp13647_c0_seq4:307-924(+)
MIRVSCKTLRSDLSVLIMFCFVYNKECASPFLLTLWIASPSSSPTQEVNAFVPLSLPSSSGAWVRQLRPYLPVTVYRWVAGVCGLCISLWLRFFGTPAPAAPTSSRGDTYYNARDGEVVDLVVELGTESPGPAADPSQQAEKVLVEWDIDGCGTLLLPAREERVGPAVGSVKQSVRSNGRTGTVQCTVSDRTGSAVKLFRFNEVD